MVPPFVSFLKFKPNPKCRNTDLVIVFSMVLLPRVLVLLGCLLIQLKCVPALKDVVIPVLQMEELK